MVESEWPEEVVRNPRIVARLGSMLREKYRLDRILGVGGMAAVYAATHRNTKRFAVKVLHIELSLHDELRTRFLREGYLANSVGHPGAVSVVDDDVDEDGTTFLVMELLQGETLDEIRRRPDRRLALRTLLDIVDQLLDVLGAAHARSIVHRDIKPANVFVTHDGHVKVLDFGVARMRDASADDTRSGLALGTPAFMAPEQARGRTDEIDGRTDLWSVGATMFTLLSGRRVHDTSSGQEAMVLAATQPAPPLASVRADVPPCLARIVDTALALAKKDRWASAAAMREAVREALRDMGDDPAANTDRRTTALGSSPGEPSAVTLTGPAAPVPSPSPLSANAAPRRRSILRTLAVTAAIATVGAVAVALPHGQARPEASALRAPSAALPSKVTLVDLPPPQSDNPVALAEFADGMRILRDGAWGRARDAFARAATADPMLAAAHLRLSMTSSNMLGTVSESHFELQKAEQLRARLSERDQLFLDALEPTLQRTPLDQAESAARLRKLTARYPNDAELFLWLGYQQQNDPVRALPAYDRAIEIDPHFSDALEARGRALAWLGRVHESRAAFETCLENPTALDCLWWLRRLDAADGSCAASELDARRRIDRDPMGHTGYNDLADALLALGRPEEGVREALAQSWQRWPVSDRQRQELQDEESLDIVRGDFVHAAVLARRELGLVGSDTEVSHHFHPISTLVRLALEAGDGKLAGQLADSFVSRAVAWTGKDGRFDMDDVLWLMHVASRYGALSEAEFASMRGAWTQKWAAPLRADPGYVWVVGYAEATDSTEEATDALSKLEGLGPLPPFFPVPTNAEVHVGRVYALAGRAAEARPHLVRAANQCERLGDPFAHSHAELELGLVSERLGETVDACEAYEAVLALWGSANARSITVERARERMRALACVAVDRP